MKRSAWSRRQALAALASLGSGACAAAPPVRPRERVQRASALERGENVTSPVLALPERPRDALTGSKFAEVCIHLRPGPRESAITTELLRGNVPPFLRRLVFVPLAQGEASAGDAATGVWVTPDYLAIGDDDDFVRFPMVKRTAINVGRAAGCVLPTSRIVDAIYATASCKITSPTHGAGPQMASTALYVSHSREIDERRGAAGCPLGSLTAGHKKDLVMSARERGEPGRLAIYGWFTAAGAIIQPLSLRHSDDYVDFSHGTRLVHEDMLVRGEPRKVVDVIQAPDLAHLLSDEGAFKPVGDV